MKKTLFFSFALFLIMGMTHQQPYTPNKKLIKETKKLFDVEDPLFIPIKTDSNLIAADKGKLFKILHLDNIIGYSYIGRVYSCRPNRCINPNSTPFNQDNAEYFLYFILLDTKARIQKVHIYDYQASRGHAIMAKSWLKQFNNYDGEKLLRYGKDIDAVSGATISATSLIKDINYLTPLLQKIIH